MDSHEMTQENVKTLDEPILEFLEFIEKKGQLNDTTIILYRFI